MIWRAPILWDNGECFIIGGGPSMPRQFGIPEKVIDLVQSGASRPSIYSPYLEPIHDRHVIGVNNAYQIGTWLDVLFFGDCAWYLPHRNRLSAWPKIKVTCCPRWKGKNKKESEGIHYIAKDSNRREGLTSDPTKVSWNSNSGAASINLAYHFGARRIILLGFDMNVSDTATHWHTGHGNKPAVIKKSFDRHMGKFPKVAEDAKALGIEILNASPTSTLDMFPRVNLKDVL